MVIMMAGKSRARLAYALDAEPYAQLVKQTGQIADKALASYGRPEGSLAELRKAVDAQLGAVSLGEWILKERARGKRPN